MGYAATSPSCRTRSKRPRPGVDDRRPRTMETPAVQVRARSRPRRAPLAGRQASGRELVDSAGGARLRAVSLRALRRRTGRRLRQGLCQDQCRLGDQRARQAQHAPGQRGPLSRASPQDCPRCASRTAGRRSTASDASRPAERWCQFAVTTRVILYADQPYVDLEVTLHNKPADPWPEAGLDLPAVQGGQTAVPPGPAGLDHRPRPGHRAGAEPALCSASTPGSRSSIPQGAASGCARWTVPLVSLGDAGLLEVFAWTICPRKRRRCT